MTAIENLVSYLPKTPRSTIASFLPGGARKVLNQGFLPDHTYIQPTATNFEMAVSDPTKAFTSTHFSSLSHVNHTAVAKENSPVSETCVINYHVQQKP